MEDLKTIRGIGDAHAAALVKLGVGNVAALAAITEPDKFVDPAVFTPENLTDWIEQAKAMTVTPAQNAGEGGEGTAQGSGTAAPPDEKTGASSEPGNGQATRSGRRRAKGKKADGDVGAPRRSVVLLVDEKSAGKRGEVVTLPAGLAEELRREGKARRATIDDFRKAGRIKEQAGI